MMANPKVKLQPYKIVCPFFVLFSSESLRVGSEGLWLLPKSKCTFVTDWIFKLICSCSPAAPSFPAGWRPAASGDSQCLTPASTLHWLSQEQLQHQPMGRREGRAAGRVRHSSSTIQHLCLSSAKHPASSSFEVNPWLLMKSEGTVPLASAGNRSWPRIHLDPLLSGCTPEAAKLPP